MTTTATGALSTASGVSLTAPQKGVYSKVPKFDERLLLSSEAKPSMEGATPMRFTVVDGVIVVLVLAVIGFIVYLVATSKPQVISSAKKKK